MEVKRIGLLGGSFDPIHHGHLILAECARTELKLDQVLIIPAAQPWQKPLLQASAEQRVAMIQEALIEHPSLTLSDIEIQRGGPTYAIDTVEYIRKQVGQQARLFLILGSDQLKNFCTWKSWTSLISLATLAAAERNGEPLHLPDELDAIAEMTASAILRVAMPNTSISSSEIRHRIKVGISIDDMVPAGVLNYIQSHRLYVTTSIQA